MRKGALSAAIHVERMVPRQTKRIRTFCMKISGLTEVWWGFETCQKVAMRSNGINNMQLDIEL